MATFSCRNQSTAVVPAPRAEIWTVLSDPDALADLTPLVSGITADGDEWCWQLTRIKALGVGVEPNFTERMDFREGTHIGFRHDDRATDERAGAEGTYELADTDDGGTKLSIDITIEVELPLPKVSKKAVEKVMATMMAKTGDRFARNLYERLGLDPAAATVPAAA